MSRGSVESVPSYWRRHGYPLASESSFSMLAIRSILEERPYPIRAAVILWQNLVAHVPSDSTVVEALKKLDFVLVMDTTWNETAKYADVVLPTKFFFETDNATVCQVSKTHIGQLALSRKAVDPPEDVDAKSVAEIVYELVKRLFPEKAARAEMLLNPEEVWREQCKLLEVDYRRLSEQGVISAFNEAVYEPLGEAGVLPTETGEIELINLKALEKFGEYLGKPHNLNPLPSWIPPRWLEGGELGEDEFVPVDYQHPLIAINTWTRDTPEVVELLRLGGEDGVFISRKRASRLGLKDGDLAVLVANGKELTVRVRVSDLVGDDVVCGVHGLNPGAHEGGAVKFDGMPKSGLNTNFLSDFQIVDGYGSAALYDFRVKLRRWRA
ncbi:MAG: molybdopterin-dependent oxidoreductase [Aigarchaeota archaeon]|nr:molybdopterin-dependent oxidoreductase [Aigarchaeota archaeon]MCS7127207.1 molybdopterin-dependent oxidoreductase [Candidatus Calditenuaceae archaeon]MDW8042662.1 molybdopterin-dependent oxidoreductase [Nitrososphaerota archaeon]